jgi:anaerobic magnesium-protoporphyrin IX monomethyl ester cyclase
MSGRILLINPARHFIANKDGVGYLTPLGLVCIGGPLIDAGFTVKLIDHDAYGWSFKKLIGEVGRFQADYVLLGHSGSTASHQDGHKNNPRNKESISANLCHLRRGLSILRRSRHHARVQVKWISSCRGEGEQTIVELIKALENKESLERVEGITWRNGNQIIAQSFQSADTGS